MYERILWMSDLSERSDACLDVVRAFGSIRGAQVTLAHATGASLQGGTPAPADEPRTQHEAELIERARDHLGECKEHLEEHGMSVQVAVFVGQADEVCSALASSHDIDLVIVGETGVSGIDRLLLGDTSSRILRASPAPVLVRKGPIGQPKKLLCPVVSTSWVSNAGAAHAMRLAQSTGAELVFLEVVPTGEADVAGTHARLAQHVLSELGRPLPQGWQVQVHQAESPAEGIVAHGKDADCVIMSSAERRGLERLLVGSVTEEVLRTCPVPVLVAR